MNGLCLQYKLCTQMLGAGSEWAARTVKSLSRASVSIRALYLVLCILSLYLKPCLETLEWVCPGFSFFVNDLVIIVMFLRECIDQVKAWKQGMKAKGLCVNMGKKFMASGINLDVLRDSGKFPCAVVKYVLRAGAKSVSS